MTKSTGKIYADQIMECTVAIWSYAILGGGLMVFGAYCFAADSPGQAWFGLIAGILWGAIAYAYWRQRRRLLRINNRHYRVQIRRNGGDWEDYDAH